MGREGVTVGSEPRKKGTLAKWSLISESPIIKSSRAREICVAPRKGSNLSWTRDIVHFCLINLSTCLEGGKGEKKEKGRTKRKFRGKGFGWGRNWLLKGFKRLCWVLVLESWHSSHHYSLPSYHNSWSKGNDCHPLEERVEDLWGLQTRDRVTLIFWEWHRL